MPRPLVALTALLSAAAVLGGAAMPASAARLRTDGLRPQPAPAQLTGNPLLARVAERAAGDPRAAEQWSHDGDRAMGIASAWRQTTGGDVTVAIVDSGVDLTHPDLAPNLWTNPGEVPGNGRDDDGNGYVDDVHGYDFAGRDGTPQDENGHGTHVAGIVAARGDNGIGIAGTAWRARLMAVRVLDANATGTTATVADGVRYAVANGARIVNLSLAGPSPAPELEAAIEDAAAHGVLVVAAAGNDGRDLASAPAYPASYALSDVLGVAATQESGALSDVSDFGAGADLAAPGQDILSTALGGGYEWRTGTSMAAPQVSGALVLLASARPDLDADGLRAALLASTRRTGLPVETGALDIGAALHELIPAAAWRPVPPAPSAATTVPAPAAHAGANRRPRTPARKARAARRARTSRHARATRVARATRRARTSRHARATRVARATRRTHAASSRGAKGTSSSHRR